MQRSMRVRTIILAVVAVWCMAGAMPAWSKSGIQADVIYGHKDGMALTYDVFSPAEANGAGVLFMVSGGWFSIWQPPERRLEGFSDLLGAGFTVFAVHHGSAPRFKVPDAVSDVRAAVRHIKLHAGDYGVAADRLGVWGGSAGGHLSLMLGLNSEAGLTTGTAEGYRAQAMAPVYLVPADANASLAAVVAYYPPVDLRPSAGPNERFPALDFPKADAAAVSPILFVDAQDPPVKLIHGDADDLVPLTASTTLKAALDKAGVTHDLLVIEGGDHGFRNPAHRQQAMQAAVAWFNQHLVQRSR